MTWWQAEGSSVKRWRKAEESEKEGLKALWDEIRRRLSNLWRAERIRRWRKRKEKERSSFFRNPFRYARGLLEEKTSGILDVSKEDLQEYICTQYSDPVRNKHLDSQDMCLDPQNHQSCSTHHHQSSARSGR